MRRALLLLLLLPASAGAWESQCAVEPAGRVRPVSPSYDHLCGTDGLASCAEGYAAARGAFLGEHTQITELAMSLAGLPGFVVQDQEVFNYFADLAPAPQAGGPAQTLEPSSPGAMRLEVNVPGMPSAGLPRRISIPEFAQVADYSYSLSDWVMGNEHCLGTSKLEYSAGAMNACHTFASHTSVVNSSHFVPQSRAIYLRYHRLALQTMDRCRAMAHARDAVGHQVPSVANRTRWVDALKACEREALALQAFASHFLEDAWSTGHMWQRWGTPLFPSPRDYVIHHLVGAYAGSIHGLRGPVLELDKALGSLAAAHDQLCRPGPQLVTESSLVGATTIRTAPPVEWTYPRARVPTGTDLGRHWGGGDTYYLRCTAGETLMPAAEVSSVDLPLTSTQPLGFHNRRMMTCVAHGFREVYARSPRALTNLFAMDPNLDPLILPDPQPGGVAAGSLSQLCWEQRVTNQSMWEGARLSNTEHSLFLPGIGGELAHQFVLGKGEFSAQDGGVRDPIAAQRVVEANRPQHSALVRAEAIRIGAWMKYRAELDPNGTDLANLEHPLMASFAGVKRNEGYLGHYDPNATSFDGGIPFFERAFTSGWNSAPSSTPCTVDSECQFDDPHSYCDRWAVVVDGGAQARCSQIEKPVVRAFRDGELVSWCREDNFQALEAARAACKGKPASAPECRACAQVIAPKLRNACDPGMQGGLQSTTVAHPKSLCDTLVAAKVAVVQGPGVNWPYEPRAGETWDEASQRAVLEACAFGAQGTPNATNALDYAYSPNVPAFPDPVAASNGTFTQNGGMCGRSQTPVRFERWRTTADYDRIWRFELRTTSTSYFGAAQSITRLNLEVLNGPRCDPALDLRTTASLLDTNADGTPDLLQALWPVTNGTPDDVCVRITTKDPLVRTGYQLLRTAN